MVLRLLNWGQAWADIFRFGMMAHWYWYSVSINLPLASNGRRAVLWIGAASCYLDLQFDPSPTQLFNLQFRRGFFAILCFIIRKGQCARAVPSSLVDCHRLCRKTIQHSVCTIHCKPIRYIVQYIVNPFNTWHTLYPNPLPYAPASALWAGLKRTKLETNKNSCLM